MKILYFARFRQLIGRGEDQLELPGDVTHVPQLIDFLKARDERIAEAFADQRRLKVAINQKHVALDASLAGAHEVAFFPPVTGG
ncbi:molybdopterin converting factor subunit 1 [Aestuariivirga litoralis]|uniref:molybdopterin converting factor subunit 1 n=1 Tax=Aestuariivirga litoralis TaxID=2650924 RepID=UPI0018C4965F|nr:molybdopterin converting factor subunit 1 [Aestuariivirga litoralis]MBG1230960.1 molybdopterin converting factor subunit 1 [Aestuariivirga litoralis]